MTDIKLTDEEIKNQGPVLKQVTPPKPNRKQRRSRESIVAHARKQDAKLNAKKQSQYESLQLWLSTQTKFSKEEADEVFKRTIKKIIKKEVEDFKSALASSIKSLKHNPLVITPTEVKDENQN